MKTDIQDEIAIIIAKYNGGPPETQYECAEEILVTGLDQITAALKTSNLLKQKIKFWAWVQQISAAVAILAVVLFIWLQGCR